MNRWQILSIAVVVALVSGFGGYYFQQKMTNDSSSNSSISELKRVLGDDLCMLQK